MRKPASLDLTALQDLVTFPDLPDCVALDNRAQSGAGMIIWYHCTGNIARVPVQLFSSWVACDRYHFLLAGLCHRGAPSLAGPCPAWNQQAGVLDSAPVAG
jgi:hypothetical protein